LQVSSCIGVKKLSQGQRVSVTYAIAAVRGPLEVKGPPVDSVCPLAFSVGCKV
jgi:hypothetical protein